MAKLTRAESLGYQINHLARLLARAIDVELAPLGVTAGQMPTLLALYEEDGLTQRTLRTRVQVEQPTLANTLSRMVRDGLVVRTPDAEDRRLVRLHLTARARRIQPGVVAAAQAINARALRGLPAGERRQMLSQLARMVANLEP